MEAQAGGISKKALAAEGVAEVAEALGPLGVKTAHLVGGIVRDAALDRLGARPDVDLALPETGLKLARDVAEKLGGTAFALDESEGAYRVVWAGGEADLVRWRGETLEKDLLGRDFTINAIAVDLFTGEFFDPAGGLNDLAAGVIRACREDSMEKDPLRALRAFRFLSSLGFEIESATAELIQNSSVKLAPGAGFVSPERVRDELFKALDGPHAGRAFRLMDAHGLLTILFPFITRWRGLDQGDYHDHDLLEHSLRVLEHVPSAVGELGEGRGWLSAHLAEAHEQSITRRALLRFSCLFHDIGKPGTRRVEESGRVRFITHDTEGAKIIREVLEELRAGRKTIRSAQNLVAAHMRLFGLAHQENPTPRSRMRFIRDLGGDAPEAVILSLCDEKATSGRAPAYAALKKCGGEILDLWRETETAPEKPAPLLMGRDLVQELGLAEGPEIGRMLKAIAEAEERGEISTREEALELARKHFSG